MSLRLRCFGLALFALMFGFALMLTTSKAEAQTTNCMAMGGGMVHCNTIGSGGMYSTDCMAMGPNMATCNTIGGGGGSIGGRPAASPVDVYRMIFGDKTRKNIGKMLANGDCQGAFKYAYEKGRTELAANIAEMCRSGMISSLAPSHAPRYRPPLHGQSPVAPAQNPTALYQTVDYLARNVPVPFAVDAAAGAFAVTKIEALNTQLRMDVQVDDPELSLADMASPANLQVICADPNFSKVLRLGGSIRLTFVRRSGVLLGTATETRQLCGF